MSVEASSAATGVTTQSEVIAEVAAEAVKAESSAQTQQVEAKAETDTTAAAKVDAKKEKDSARWAAIARKDKEQRAESQRMKAEREAIAAERAEIETFRKAKEQAKLDPLGYLKAAGLDYGALTQTVLNDNKPPVDVAVRAVEEKLEAFKRQQDEEREKAIKSEQARIEAEAQQLTDQWHSEARKFVESNAEAYELTNLFGAHEYVIALIEAEYAKSGKALQYKEAADLVEKHFEETGGKSKKLAAKFAPAAKVEPQPKGDEKRTEVAPRKTLSNSMTASTQTKPKPKGKPEDEAMARANAKYEEVAAKRAQAKR